MGLVDVSQLTYPEPGAFVTWPSFSGNASHQMNGSGHRIGQVFSMLETCTITKVGIRINACASAVTSRLGLYTVDSSGNPTTTPYGGSNYGTFTPAANTYSEVTLGTSCSAVAGDIVALVVDFDSSAGDMFLSANNGTSYSHGLPYSVKYDGSSWARSPFGQLYAGHLYTSDDGGRFLATRFPAIWAAVDTIHHNSSSTPDEHANKLTLPFACRVSGLWCLISPGGGADFNAVLYDGTTVLESVSVGSLQVRASGADIKFIMFDTPVEVEGGDIVYASIVPTTTTSLTTQKANLFAAGAATTLGFGPNDCRATRTNSGAWTDDATTIMAIGLILDQLSDGSGGGGFSGSPFRNRVFA